MGVDEYEMYGTLASSNSQPDPTPDHVASFAAAHGKLVAWSETATSSCDGSYLTSLAGWFDALGSAGAYLSYFDEGGGFDVIHATSGAGSCPASADRAALNASSFGQVPFGGTWYPRH